MNESSIVPPALTSTAERADVVAPTSRVAPFVFPLAIVFLAVVALLATFAPRRAPLSGLPAAPLVELARTRVHGRLSIPLGGLRHRSELLGDLPPARGPRPDSVDLAKTVEDLGAQYVRGGGDPRVMASLAALDLAQMRLERAETKYRSALRKRSDYPEGRLGLGVTLAIRAETQPSIGRAQALRLKAIAQFAAVDERAPEYPAALYDRAIVLARAGRLVEARRLADNYRRLDPGSAWAGALSEALSRAE